MKGLFLQEIYSMKRALKFYVLLWGIYFVVGIFSASSVSTYLMTFLPLMIVVNSFSYHNVSKWDVYANTLPVTKKQLVGVQYLLAVLTILLSVASCILLSVIRCGGLVSHIAENSSENFYGMASLFYNFTGITVLFAIVIPLLIRFGVENGRIFLIIIVFVIYGVLFGLEDEILKIGEMKDFPLVWIFSSFLAVALFAFSFWVSLYFYKKKEF